MQDMPSHGATAPRSGPRRGSVVHAAQDSPQRDLASGGTRGVIRPEIAPGGPWAAEGLAGGEVEIIAEVRDAAISVSVTRLLDGKVGRETES